MQLWQMDVMGGVLLTNGTELKVDLTGGTKPAPTRPERSQIRTSGA